MQVRVRLLASIGLLVTVAGCVEPSESGGGSATSEPSVSELNLPETKHLEVVVEGQRELRLARLFESPQGYAIYVLPQIVMTPEEPGRDQAFARVDGDFFLRIERLEDSADLDDLRGNARLWLASIGEPHGVPEEEILDPNLRRAHVYLRASGQDVSANVLIMDIDNARFRLTMHLPHRESAEGITPSFWSMIKSIRRLTPEARERKWAPDTRGRQSHVPLGQS